MKASTCPGFRWAAMSFHDLEQGRGIPPEQELEAQPNHDASRGENPQFMRLTEQVGLHVFRINANVATLQKLDAQLRRAPDLAQGKTDQIMRQFADLCEQTRSIVKDATDDVKKLSLYPIGGNEGYGIRRSSPSRLMQTKLQNDFQDALSAFQQIQKSGIRKEKDALAQAKQRGNEVALSTERAPDTDERTSEPTQTQIPMPSRLTSEEIEFQESLIAEREAEIQEIEHGVQELNEIFRDLSHIVQEQGGMIDNIEYNIGTIATSAQGADRELFRANNYQRRAGRRGLCLTMIVAVVVSLVLVAVRMRTVTLTQQLLA